LSGNSDRSGKSADPRRQVAFRAGTSAENWSAALLMAKGFRILARRWKCPLGEIDLIARRRKLLIFVEVKARGQLADAEWSITPHQSRRIAAAAEVWLSLHPDDHILDIRFDAILVAPARFPRHIPAAFDASTAEI
jgi:putative endonuclease